MSIGLRLAWVCSRSQGQPPGARRRAIRATSVSKAGPGGEGGSESMDRTLTRGLDAPPPHLYLWRVDIVIRPAAGADIATVRALFDIPRAGLSRDRALPA